MGKKIVAVALILEILLAYTPVSLSGQNTDSGRRDHITPPDECPWRTGFPGHPWQEKPEESKLSSAHYSSQQDASQDLILVSLFRGVIRAFQRVCIINRNGGYEKSARDQGKSRRWLSHVK